MPMRKPKFSPVTLRPTAYQVPRMRQTSAWPRMKPAIASLISLRQPANGVAVARRHPAVDLLDHVVPVDQQIEGDHRRHARSAKEHADDGVPPTRATQEAAEPARASATKSPSEFCRSGGRFLPPKRSRRGRAALASKPAAWRHTRAISRRERRSSVPEAAASTTAATRRRSARRRQDHERRHEPVHAQALQPVGQRIQQIGEHQPGDEGQQDTAEAH